MKHAIQSDQYRATRTSAARIAAVLVVTAAVLTLFGLMTGNPEAGATRTMQSSAAATPVASAPVSAPTQPEPAASDGDGNVFMYQ